MTNEKRVFEVASQVAAETDSMVLTRGQSYRHLLVVPQGALRDANATAFGNQLLTTLQDLGISVVSIKATRTAGWDVIHTRDVDIWLMRNPEQEPQKVVAVNPLAMQLTGFSIFLLWLFGLVVAPSWWGKALCFLVFPSFYFTLEFLVRVLTNG